MGIIAKQSIQSTIYSYAGTVFGFFNAAILLPNLLEPENKGLIDFLSSMMVIFGGIFTMGVPLITIKLFPKYRTSKDNSHNGFFSFTATMTLIGFVLGMFIFVLFNDFWISEKNVASEYRYFLPFFTILLLFRILHGNFDTYIRMLYQTVLGTFTVQVLQKLIFCVALVAYALYPDMGYDVMLLLLVFSFLTPGIVDIVYLIKKSTVNLYFGQFLSKLKEQTESIWSIGFYGFLASIGTILVLEIDKLMISNMLGLDFTGVYTTAAYFAIFVGIPARGLRRVASVIISDSWKNNDLENIIMIYKKSSVNLFLISGYLFLGIWFCADYTYQLMKPEYSSGKYVILFLGISQLVDMATGANAEILETSKYYKYRTYFTLLLIIFVIVSNYLLIPKWQMHGAAIASLASMSLINILRTTFLYYKFRFQPFNFKTILILLLIIVVFIASIFIPSLDNKYMGILVSGTIITILYWVPAYFLHLSEDINKAIDKRISKFKK